MGGVSIVLMFVCAALASHCNIKYFEDPPYDNYVRGHLMVPGYVSVIRTKCSADYLFECSQPVTNPATVTQQLNCYREIISRFNYYTYKCNFTLDPCEILSIGKYVYVLDFGDYLMVGIMGTVVLVIVITIFLYSIKKQESYAPLDREAESAVN